MDNLYLRSTKYQGLGNVLCNIILILIDNLEKTKFKKLIIIFDRQDNPMRFCQPVHNSMLEFRDNFGELQRKNVPTVKSYQQKHNLRGILFDNVKLLKKVFKYFKLEPNVEISNLINEYQQKMGKYISIHVRTTDFETKILKKKENSTSLDNYYSFLDQHPKLSVWLATDNPLIQQKMVDKYGDRIHFYQTLTSEYQLMSRHTSATSIFVDFFMCQHSKEFVGTYKSTFSQFINILRKYYSLYN